MSGPEVQCEEVAATAADQQSDRQAASPPAVPHRPPPTRDEVDDDSDDAAAVGPGADEEWEEWTDEDGNTADDEPTPSLFEPSLVLESPQQAFDHDRDKHGFDLRQFIKQVMD
jgi:hypothetical protein